MVAKRDQEEWNGEKNHAVEAIFLLAPWMEAWLYGTADAVSLQGHCPQPHSRRLSLPLHSSVPAADPERSLKAEIRKDIPGGNPFDVHSQFVSPWFVIAPSSSFVVA